MNESKNLTITDFKCMICQDIIAFDFNNSSTFNSSSLIEEFFSMKLTRFSVSHYKNEEEHVNIVIVDQDGRYRGHKDGYINKNHNKSISQPYIVSSGQLLKHSKVELFFVLNLKNRSAKEYINSININSMNLIEKIESFIKENKEIYNILPPELTFSYANKKFSLLTVEEDIFSCIAVNEKIDFSTSIYFKIFEILKTIINGSDENSPLIKLIYIIIKISDLPNIQETDLKYIQTMVESNAFFSELKINPDYKDKMIRNVKSFVEEFPCSNFVLNPMLDKNSILIDIFDNHLEQYKCIIDFIEFLKRRRLFIF